MRAQWHVAGTLEMCSSICFLFLLDSSALLLYVEVTACLWRRGRDFLMATAAWRNNDEAFKVTLYDIDQPRYIPYV